MYHKCSSGNNVSSLQGLLLINRIIVFSILTDVTLAAFPLLLLWNMRLPKRQKIQLNCLLGLGIVTAMACIVRTIFSYEVKQPDVTWQGVPNALCRMLEINLGIIAACMPMMRTLFISTRKRFKSQRKSESLTTIHTSGSQLQWYRPSLEVPWYLRIKRSLWHPPPTMDMANQLSASESDRSLSKPEKTIEQFPKPPLIQRKSRSGQIPKTHPPPHRGKSPRHHDRPANATWAKNDSLGQLESLDLPIQGERRQDWDDHREEDGQDPGLGTYRYHRNWV